MILVDGDPGRKGVRKREIRTTWNILGREESIWELPESVAEFRWGKMKVTLDGTHKPPMMVRNVPVGSRFLTAPRS